MKWFDHLRDIAGWPKAPAPKRKSVLVMGADGKKHRTDPITGQIIGKVARKRHERGLRKNGFTASSGS